MDTDGINARSGSLEAKIARSAKDIDGALALRYEVFNLELAEGLPASRDSGRDRDAYDDYCDHLIVVDHERDGAVVGTYRLIRGDVAASHGGFYSETEFELDCLGGVLPRAVELGRSCVHRDYRGGQALRLLWVGISRYMLAHGSRYLIGCGSVPGLDPDLASDLHAYLRDKGALTPPELTVRPRPAFSMDGFDQDRQLADPRDAARKLPVLIKGYVRMGSKVSGQPAADREFGTTDFFVMLDRDRVLDSVAKRYD
ncbi:MAG: GNAT family N-acetyltransferase [Spirochaetales bacterium]|nr:GNAT family N-acetyltransferase [Spirochaetales bacterium]